MFFIPKTPPTSNEREHHTHLRGEMQPRAIATPRALANASPGASPPYPLAFTIRRVVTASSPVGSPPPAGSPSSGPNTLLSRVEKPG